MMPISCVTETLPTPGMLRSGTRGMREISMEPSKLSLDIDFEIKYDNETIGSQRNKVDVYQDDLQEIFSSRTFCFKNIEFITGFRLEKKDSCFQMQLNSKQGWFGARFSIKIAQ